MLTLQQVSDRLEIQDLMAAYSAAIDNSDWDGLDAVFTPDAVIDYTAVGGPVGDLATIKHYLARVMPEFKSFQHLTGPTQLKVDGNTATGRTIVFNPIVFHHQTDEHVLFVGLWYCDTFVRTGDQWRVSVRREERCYQHNMPTWFVQQPA